MFGVAKMLRPKKLPFLTNKQVEKMKKQGKEIPEIKIRKGIPRLAEVAFTYLDDKMDYAFYWAVFSTMQIDLFLGAWSTIKVVSVTKPIFIFSTLFLLGLIANYAVFMVVITKGFFDFYLPKSDKKTYSKELENSYRTKNERYLRIFSTIKQQSTSGVWILGLIATKDMLLPLVLIYGIENPFI